jgi:hypothetical protein
MISQQLLFDLFETEVNHLAAALGLSATAHQRILRVFQAAMQDPYMDERRIFPALCGKETDPS